MVRGDLAGNGAWFKEAQKKNAQSLVLQTKESLVGGQCFVEIWLEMALGSISLLFSREFCPSNKRDFGWWRVVSGDLAGDGAWITWKREKLLAGRA